MFTWICPQCGREVPPSYTECPDCTSKERQQAQQAQPPQPAGSAASPQAQPEYVPPPVPPPPAAPSQVRVAAYQPPPPAPAARGGLPTWLMTIVFALAFLGLGAGIYWLVGWARSGRPTVTVESPAAKAGAK